jgi:hypothetical protein
MKLSSHLFETEAHLLKLRDLNGAGTSWSHHAWVHVFECLPVLELVDRYLVIEGFNVKVEELNLVFLENINIRQVLASVVIREVFHGPPVQNSFLAVLSLIWKVLHHIVVNLRLTLQLLFPLEIVEGVIVGFTFGV